MFKEIVERMEHLESLVLSRTLAQFRPDANGMVRFPKSEPIKTSKEKD